MHHDAILSKLSSVLKDTDEKFTERVISTIDSAEKIFITGAGRSGLVARFFVMRLMHCGYQVYLVGETVTPSLKKDDLLIVVSGSGSTESLLPLARKAKALGAPVALITMKSESAIGNVADIVLPMGNLNSSSFDAPSSMPMGTVFELSTLVFLESVIADVVKLKGIKEDYMRELHANLE
tara:strand:- start:11723 stop:12262 length:540 start_codon:yes stop_codon:yes gene_type:complete